MSSRGDTISTTLAVVVGKGGHQERRDALAVAQCGIGAAATVIAVAEVVVSPSFLTLCVPLMKRTVLIPSRGMRARNWFFAKMVSIGMSAWDSLGIRVVSAQEGSDWLEGKRVAELALGRIRLGLLRKSSRPPCGRRYGELQLQLLPSVACRPRISATFRRRKKVPPGTSCLSLLRCSESMVLNTSTLSHSRNSSPWSSNRAFS